MDITSCGITCITGVISSTVILHMAVMIRLYATSLPFPVILRRRIKPEALGVFGISKVGNNVSNTFRSDLKNRWHARVSPPHLLRTAGARRSARKGKRRGVGEFKQAKKEEDRDHRTPGVQFQGAQRDRQ